MTSTRILSYMFYSDWSSLYGFHIFGLQNGGFEQRCKSQERALVFEDRDSREQLGAPRSCGVWFGVILLYFIIYSVHYSMVYIYICIIIYNYILFYYRRKFRSQTSDNMDRWKAEQGRGREKRKTRREKIREEKESEERRCRCAKR